MRSRLRDWKLWCLVAAGAIIAYGAWLNTRQVPIPDIPRPDPSAFTERDVQMDVAGAARRVESEPRSAHTWGEYGIVLRAYRQHAEADQCFRVAAGLDPSDGRWPYLLGTHLAETDSSAAIEWLERAARATVPAAARETVLARLAEVLLAAGRPEDALAWLDADADSTTSSPRIRLVAARAAAATGDDRSAAEFLGDLGDHPYAARKALLLRAEICRRQGRTSYAEHLATRAADMPEGVWPDPFADPIRSRDISRGGRLDEAARLLRAGRPADAERVLRPLTTGRFVTDARALVGLAEARLAQGDRNSAMEALFQAVRVEPKNLAANYQIGLLHFSSGENLWVAKRTDEALAEFRQAIIWLDNALTISPDFGKGLLLKGAALHRFLGKPEEGLALLRRFVKLRPEVAEGHFLLGQALAESGERDAAVASLRRAVELAPPGDRRAAEALANLATAGRK